MIKNLNFSVTLTFGDQVISNSSESGEIEQVADQFFIHSGYNSKKALNDIALIRLYEPVRFGPTINPACLATDDDVLYEVIILVKIYFIFI